MIRINSDWSEVFDELTRLESMPDERMSGLLDGVLREAFYETQFVVHIETGSLRRSGKVTSDDGNHKWEGQITYGGSSNGAPHDPVRYAGYEQDRGGSHDFMRPLYHYHEAFKEAVVEGLRGEDF